MIKFAPLRYPDLPPLNFRKIDKKIRFLDFGAQYPGKAETFLPRAPRLCGELVQNRIIFLNVAPEFGTISALAWPSG